MTVAAVQTMMIARPKARGGGAMSLSFDEQAEFVFAMLDHFEKAMILIWDENLRLVYLNRLACEWSGFEREDVLGQELGVLYPQLRNSMLPGAVLDEERNFLEVDQFYWRHPVTGEVKHWCSDYFFLRLPDGRRAVAIRSMDVTKRVHAEQRAVQERQNLYTVLQQIPAACAVLRLVDGDMIYELSNDTNDQWAGKGALQGRSAMEAFSEFEGQSHQNQGFFAIFREVFRTGQRFEASGVYVVVRTAAGVDRELYLNVVIEPLPAGHDGIDRILLFATDVTNEVVAQRDLEQAKGQLEGAVRLRDEFISMASHELRTPISTISLLAETMRHVVAPYITESSDLAKKLLKLRDAMRRQSKRLTELVDDMLDVPRLQSGKAELELRLTTVDLAEVVQEMGARFSEPAEAAKCELCFDLSPVVGVWDAHRLMQIIANFLSNAIKYGAGTPVLIRTFQEGNTAVLTVRDHGPGVAPGDRTRIFEKFERAVPAGAVHGLGLGLWIANKAASLMGGEVRLTTPEDGHGAQFELHLPIGGERG